MVSFYTVKKHIYFHDDFDDDDDDDDDDENIQHI